MLEHDDTSSYGPETVYVSGVGGCSGRGSSCDIKYMLNDYRATGKMLREGAEVTLYTGSRVAGTWKISDCPGSVDRSRNWWHVFTLDGKTNKLKWSCNTGAGALLQNPTSSLLMQNSTLRDAGSPPSSHFLGKLS